MDQQVPLEVKGKYGTYKIDRFNHDKQTWIPEPLTDTVKGPAGEITRHLEFDPVTNRFIQIGVEPAGGGASRGVAGPGQTTTTAGGVGEQPLPGPEPQSYGDLETAAVRLKQREAAATDLGKGYAERTRALQHERSVAQTEIEQMEHARGLMDNPA